TVMVGSAPPPNVVMMAPSSPPPNVLLAAPAAPQPVQMAPQPQPQPLMAPQPMMAAPAAPPQQSVLGTAALGLLLENPGLINRILGAIGRLLVRRGNPTVQMTSLPQTIQVPLAQAQAAQPPAYVVSPAPCAPPPPC